MKKLCGVAPFLEPATDPVDESHGGRKESRYSLFSFDGMMSYPSKGVRFGDPIVPICGHYVLDKKSLEINGQVILSLVDASTLEGKMESKGLYFRGLEFSVEDSGLKKLMSLKLVMGDANTPVSQLQSPHTYRGTYKHGHVQGSVTLSVKQVLNEADFLESVYPHVFRSRKQKP